MIFQLPTSFTHAHAFLPSPTPTTSTHHPRQKVILISACFLTLKMAQFVLKIARFSLIVGLLTVSFPDYAVCNSKINMNLGLPKNSVTFRGDFKNAMYWCDCQLSLPYSVHSPGFIQYKCLPDMGFCICLFGNRTPTDKWSYINPLTSESMPMKTSSLYK